MSANQIQVNSSNKLFFNSCLIISRHKLLSLQEEDIKTVCKQIDMKPELPTDPSQLKSVIQQYDTIVGVLPLTLQVQILQAKKTFLTFIMESLGVFDSEEDAKKKANEFPGRTAILTPSKQGEKYRVTLYKGLKAIKEIKVVDEWVIQHQG